MYNKLKELKITDRIVNEDNDYLLKEEYDKLIKIKNKYDSVLTIIDEFNQYCKSTVTKEYPEDKYIIIPSTIKIVKESSYTVTNYNDIHYEMRVYLGEKYITTVNKKEERFKLEHIKKITKCLDNMVNDFFLLEKSSYGYSYSDYNYYTFRFNNLKKILKEIKDVVMLVEYFNDKIVTIEKDEKLLKELQEIDDFLENL